MSVDPVASTALRRKLSIQQKLLQGSIIKSAPLVQSRDNIDDPYEKLKKGSNNIVMNDCTQQHCNVFVEFFSFFYVLS